MTLSESARQMLRDLVTEERSGISRGDISYGTEGEERAALEALDELDALTDTERVPA